VHPSVPSVARRLQSTDTAVSSPMARRLQSTDTAVSFCRSWCPHNHQPWAAKCTWGACCGCGPCEGGPGGGVAFHPQAFRVVYDTVMGYLRPVLHDGLEVTVDATGVHVVVTGDCQVVFPPVEQAAHYLIGFIESELGQRVNMHTPPFCGYSFEHLPPSPPSPPMLPMPPIPPLSPSQPPDAVSGGLSSGVVAVIICSALFSVALVLAVSIWAKRSGLLDLRTLKTAWSRVTIRKMRAVTVGQKDPPVVPTSSASTVPAAAASVSADGGGCAPPRYATPYPPRTEVRAPQVSSALSDFAPVKDPAESPADATAPPLVDTSPAQVTSDETDKHDFWV
jgi:hypothetical protein